VLSFLAMVQHQARKAAPVISRMQVESAAALADALASSLDVLADASGIVGLQHEAAARTLETFRELRERLAAAGLEVGV